MLSYHEAISSFSVDDTAKAKAFYQEVLGLTVEELEMPGLLKLDLKGGQQILIYPKPDHLPASFTILNLMVDDVEAAVDELTQNGVIFERYDQPELHTNDKGIMRAHGTTIAWFKDPAGNILALLQAS